MAAEVSPVTYNGGCFAYYQNKILLLGYEEELDGGGGGHDHRDDYPNAKTMIHTLWLDSDFVTPANPNRDNKLIEKRRNITISVLGGNAYFNNQLLYERSGIKAIFTEQPQDIDEL